MCTHAGLFMGAVAVSIERDFVARQLSLNEPRTLGRR